jgi:hypothetical protein
VLCFLKLVPFHGLGFSDMISKFAVEPGVLENVLWQHITAASHEAWARRIAWRLRLRIARNYPTDTLRYTVSSDIILVVFTGPWP